jgi:DnaJ-class molecular chaperone
MFCSHFDVCAQYGEEAVKEGMGGGGAGPGGMTDLFDILSGGGRRGPRGPRRGEDVVHRLRVSMEELYNGNVRCACGAKIQEIGVRSERAGDAGQR